MKYSIKVNEVQGTDSHIKGFATVVFGGAFKISNIAILENRETGDLFVSMPRYKSRGVDQDNNPIYKDICNPTTKEFREQLYGDIMDAYHALKEKDKAQETVVQEEAEMPEFSILVTAWSSKDSNVRGLASIYFEDCFIVNNVSILQGKENLFVAMPSYKTKKVDDNNKPIYADVCYPITKEFREKLYTELITECEKQLEKVKEINPQTGKPYNRRERMQKEDQEQAENEQPEKKQSSKKQEKKGR